MAKLFETIQRRRLPHWLLAYLAAAWGCIEATGFFIESYGVSSRVLDLVVFLLFGFLFVTLVLAWYHGERGPQRPTRMEVGLLGTLLCVAVTGSMWISTADASPSSPDVFAEIETVDLGERSLVVLPFQTTVTGPEMAWLARGLPELLSIKLGQVEGLRVLSTQRLVDLLEQLDVHESQAIEGTVRAHLLEASGARLAIVGTIFGDPGNLTITASLTDASSGEIRTSGTVRGDDIMELVDRIAAALRPGITDGGHAELPSIASLATAEVDAYRAYEEGRRAFQRYLLPDAADHFARALAVDSTFALARFWRALTLFHQGLITEAANEARRARSDLDAASERDRLFVEAFDSFSSDTTRAVALVRELVRKYPDEKDARIIFATVLAGLRSDVDTEARSLLTETLRLDPSYGPAYNVLAYSYAASGDFDIADSLSLRYVQLEPDQANSWDTRGEILELQGRVSDARDAYRRALRLRPDFRFAINHLARSYLEVDDPDGARRELAALQASPLPDVRIRAQALEADAWLWQGEVDRAMSLYEAAEREAERLGREELRVWRLRDLVQLRLALGDHASAMRAARTIRQLEPADGWWITALYDSLLAVGDVQALERWKPEVEAQLRTGPFPEDRLVVVSRLIDAWIALAQGDHASVVRLGSGLPTGMRAGVATRWPVFESMLELGQTDQLLEALRPQRWPDLFTRGPRFQPLRVRWAQYFQARAYEASGDSEAAAAEYEALLRGMSQGITRFPRLRDVPSRLESLHATEREAREHR